MINNDTAKSTYTVTAGVMEYPIGFQYTTNPDGTPNLYVCIGDLYGDNTELEYAAGYELSADGESVVVLAAVEVGATLNIALSEPFEQDSDYTIGRIDPEQIERDFDKTVLRDLELRDYINDTRSRMDGKQEQIPDLDDIRAGAAAGATAVQPSDLATVATTGSYNDLIDKPSVGAVSSVNGKTGVVVLNATDVGALPNTTKYGASLVLSMNSSTYVLTATLKDQNGNTLGSAQTIDLPLESVVVSGAYDSATKEVVLTLQSGSVIRFSVADLVSGLQTEITSLNMLSADLVDDTNSTHKFVTASEKTAISTAVQPADLPSVMTGADGTNAGTSGLVPAPAATDNVKFLSGDGTWKTALVNKARTNSGSLSILGDGTSQSYAINIGENSEVGGGCCIAIGGFAKSCHQRTGTHSIAIGYYAVVNAAHAIQLDASGSGATGNPDADTFKVANSNGNFEIMSADGTVPTARLTKVNTTATLAVADWSSNTQTVSVTGMTADGVVFVNPTPANQSAYTDAGILCTAQAAGSLTFTCDTVPSTNITVTVVML